MASNSTKVAGRNAVLEVSASQTTPSDQATLELRLEDGYRRIEEAKLRGIDVRAWEDFWLQLLHEYEDVCDGLRLAAA